MRLNFLLDKTFCSLLSSSPLPSPSIINCRVLSRVYNEFSTKRIVKSSKLSIIQCRNYSTSASKFRQLSVLFYGSDDFSLASLCVLRRNLLNDGEDYENSKSTVLKRLEVITNSDHNPVSAYCKQMKLPCHSFDSYKVPANQFDIGVVSSFGRLISSQAIQACHYGILNVHGSLLPRWRGASPIQHTIWHDDKVAGLTIMSVKPKKFDVGEIIAQKEIEIFNRITAVDLKKMMSPLGARLLWECVENLDDCLANARPQPEDGVTYAPKLKKSDGEIDWNRMDSREIDCRYRAMVGFVDTFTYWIDGTVLKLNDSVDPDLVARFDMEHLSGLDFGSDYSTDKTHQNHIPGLVVYHKKRHLLCVASANGTWSAFRTLTLKGRKKMSALGFYNTFIRPIRKAYKLSNGGQVPYFILGKVSIETNAEVPKSSEINFDHHHHSPGIYSFDQIQTIIDRKRTEEMSLN